MKTARISAPGILLGRYPERRIRETPSALSRLMTNLLRSNPRAQQRRCHAFVASVRTLQPTIAGESEQILGERTLRLRAQLAREGLVDAVLTQAFAVVAVVCRRALGVEPYDTQLFAARLMLDGQLAEMATGEGKTLVAALGAATAALAGIPVHVVTANDYLVARDAATLRALYQALGLTVGAVTQALTAPARRDAYACDITYCTAKELVFDYLRDSIAAPQRSALEQRAAELGGAAAPQRLLRGLCMAIIDEADSILIDEARVPLVLSQAVADPAQAHLQRAWKLSAGLEPAAHFTTDLSRRSAQLTPIGREHLRALAAVDAYPWLNTRHCEDTVTQALTARHLLRRGRDFVVEEGQVHIVDETTGRKAPGRSWSHGLHQLVEIKEGCAPSAQVMTLAQITYQCFFPRYFKLCGMSGTLMEARGELLNIYDLQVATVPLRRPSQRKGLPTQVFENGGLLWPAVAARVRELHEQGRPVLVGTDSVLDSELLSRLLHASGLPHALLNASQDRHEAQIIAAAGAPGAITVATNMAGRGTDIILADASRVAGGLHVISCQQNASRRIDRQLMGRCARQGDPGSVELFIALSGPILARSSITKMFKNIIKNNNLHINKLVTLLLRQAQRLIERRHRIEREMLMRQDQRVNDWFAFSGTEK
jgi:preprotein translocase subunit SecA